MKLLLENWRKYMLKEGYILDDDFFESSIEALFEKLKDYGDNTWIFFDTETTGFKPSSAQLTEIGAVSAYPDNWQFTEVEAEQGIFYDKIRLTPEVLAYYKDAPEGEDDPKYPLKLTRYGMSSDEYREKYPGGMPEEIDVIKQFISYIKNQNNPILVAQNAEFDINFVQTRAEFYGFNVNLRDYPIFDTMILIKLWHNPLIKTLAQEGDERAQRILKALTVQGKFGEYTSASMGPVSAAYEVNTDEWHNAIADVKMMMGMTKEIFMTLQQSSGTDISDPQGRAAWGLRKKKSGYHRSDK
jgi:DNA polymerase III epsilon subunit-like protein